MAPRFEYPQAEEIRDALARHGVRYLFLGKSGAILLGYPDTTQDADLFLDRSPENGQAAVAALLDLGFTLTEVQAEEIRRGKDFIQLRHGPFDIDLIYAPDGIASFDAAWARHLDVEGFPVCRAYIQGYTCRDQGENNGHGKDLSQRQQSSGPPAQGVSLPARHRRGSGSASG